MRDKACSAVDDLASWHVYLDPQGSAGTEEVYSKMAWMGAQHKDTSDIKPVIPSNVS